MAPLDLQLIAPRIEYVAGLLEGRHVAVFGGFGWEAAEAVRHGAASALWIDDAPPRLAYAAARLGARGLTLHRAPADRTGLGDGTVDVIVAVGLPAAEGARRAALTEWRRILDADGFLYLCPAGSGLRPAPRIPEAELRADLRRFFPHVEILTQRAFLGTDIGPAGRRAPSWISAGTGAPEPALIAMCSRLLIVPEEVGLTVHALGPTEAAARATLGRRRRQLDGLHLALQRARNAVAQHELAHEEALLSRQRAHREEIEALRAANLKALKERQEVIARLAAEVDRARAQDKAERHAAVEAAVTEVEARHAHAAREAERAHQEALAAQRQLLETARADAQRALQEAAAAQRHATEAAREDGQRATEARIAQLEALVAERDAELAALKVAPGPGRAPASADDPARAELARERADLRAALEDARREMGAMRQRLEREGAEAQALRARLAEREAFEALPAASPRERAAAGPEVPDEIWSPPTAGAPRARPALQSSWNDLLSQPGEARGAAGWAAPPEEGEGAREDAPEVPAPSLSAWGRRPAAPARPRQGRWYAALSEGDDRPQEGEIALLNAIASGNLDKLPQVTEEAEG